MTTPLQRPDLRPTIRPRYLVGATLLAGVALGTGVWEYAKRHVHETMPRVVDCRADESTLDCQVAIDVAMFRTMHEVPSDLGHFVVTIVDCNGLTWTLDSHAQQATISVDRERHCVEVRGFTETVPGVVTYGATYPARTAGANVLPDGNGTFDTTSGDTLMVDGPTQVPPEHFLTPAEVRAKLGIRLHP